MSENKPQKDSKKGGNRVQSRAQEFIKKLRLNNIKSQLRTVRKFIVSAATTDKHSVAGNSVSAKRETTNFDSSSSSSKSNILYPLRCDSLESDNLCGCIAEPRGSAICENIFSNGKKFSIGKISDESSVISYFNEYVLPKLSLVSVASKMDQIIPNVIVETENDATNEEYVASHVEVNNVSGKIDDQQQEEDNSTKLQLHLDGSSRNKSPVTVQEWVDSLPLTPVEEPVRDECDLNESILDTSTELEPDNLTLGAEAGHLCTSAASVAPVSVTVTSCHERWDTESHCSSVDSLLEARKPDPEEILMGLGFGGTMAPDELETGRIPKRFLHPSKLKGVSIEDFIRQQQNMIQTYECGYSGYRGLSGPMYSTPSTIVAKIMEKLREHDDLEAGVAASTSSYRRDFRNQESDTQSQKTNKFSHAARDVLTKIRCAPGSVLSPDNRRWLDSQGKKSPEVCRRLILGEQSFTFSNDGDLIESPSSSLTDKRGPAKKGQRLAGVTRFVPGFLVARREEQDRYIYEISLGKRFSNSNSSANKDNSNKQTELNNSIIVEEENSNGLNSSFIDCNDSLFVEHKSKPEQISSHHDIPDSSQHKSGNLNKTASQHEYDRESISRDNNYLNNLPPSSYASSSSSETSAHNRTKTHFKGPNERSLRDQLKNGLEEVKIQEYHRTENRFLNSSENLSSLSLKDELKDSGVHLTSTPVSDMEFSIDENFSMSASSSEHNADNKGNFRPILDPIASDTTDESNGSEKAQFSDSPTDSEFSTCSSSNKVICKQYEDLLQLVSHLQTVGRDVDIGLKDHFLSISPYQRCVLQTRIMREALSVYLNQLTDDEMHLELKTCLSVEAQKISDLLDMNCDSSKLSIIVKQMSLLLQHQNDLCTQIKDLSKVEKKPSVCHDMCDHILKRVQELEQLVQQNAQELAQMKFKLENKDDEI